MSILAKPFGSEPDPERRRTTADKLGRELFAASMEHMRDLHSELVSLGALQRRPNLDKSVEYAVQLAAFAMAPLDQVLGDVPLPDAPRIRTALRSAWAAQFRMAKEKDAVVLLNKMLATYASAGRAGNVARVGELAADAIGFPDDQVIQGLFADNYFPALNHWLTVISGFQVVDG